MVSVNPPPQIILPQSLIDLGPDVVNYFQQQNRFDLQLWTRTGGASDEIDNSAQNLTSTGSRVSKNAAIINSLQLKEFEIVIVTADFETSGNQILICKNTIPIQITLDPNAIEEDELHIKRRDEEIEEIGTIDGLPNRTISVLQHSDHLVFDGIDWSVI